MIVQGVNEAGHAVGIANSAEPLPDAGAPARTVAGAEAR